MVVHTPIMPAQETAAPAADLLTIELGSSSGTVHWTIRVWSHKTVQGALDMSVQHKDGGFSQYPGHPRSERSVDEGLRLALRNKTGWMVLSDSSGRMEEGTRL
jgi:hypothetical protein